MDQIKSSQSITERVDNRSQTLNLIFDKLNFFCEEFNMSDKATLESVNKIEGGWCEKEFSTIKLGDKRLNNRLIKMAEDLSNQLSSPINQASNDWSSAKAAYRLFDNEAVTAEKILAPHIENTIERMTNYKKLLAVQDTTSFNFGGHTAVEGLGHIGKEETQGFMQHNTMIVTPDGLPLGLIHQLCWTRPQTVEEKRENALIDIEERESSKWLIGLHNTHERKPEGVEVITVCDREADIYEFLDEAVTLQEKFLVRLKVNREIDESGEPIKEFLKSQPSVAEYVIEVPKKKGEYPSRVAQLEVRYAAVTVDAPAHLESSVKNDEIKMYGIYVTEVNAPEGIKPIKWFLLTNDRVGNAADALEKVGWYRTRWLIETYHKVEKSCCAIEDCRLETVERLLRFIALKSIIAWRVLWFTYMNRQNPDAPASKILSEPEIKIMEAKINKKRKDNERFKKIKTVRQAVRAVASLGGHMGRLSDNEPGIIAISRGLERLHDLSEGVLLARFLKVMGNR